MEPLINTRMNTKYLDFNKLKTLHYRTLKMHCLFFFENSKNPSITPPISPLFVGYHHLREA